jgi:YD repeat-containing protein
MLTETLDTGIKLQYVYDQLDRLIQVLLPDHSFIRYQYDSHNLLRVERIQNGVICYAHEFSDYDLVGNHKTEKMLGKARLRKIERDPLQRVIRNQAPHYDEKLAYDAVGNLISKTVSDLQHHYTYYNLYQLISEQGNIDHNYLYDS